MRLQSLTKDGWLGMRLQSLTKDGWLGMRLQSLTKDGWLGMRLQSLTKDGWLLIRTEVVIGQIKEDSQFLREEVAKRLVVLLPYETVREDTETLVYPQAGHGILGVVVVLVGT